MAHLRHEHEFEPEPGLPERLPAGERLLWQGAPAPGCMARKVFHLHAAAGYFALLLAWQVLSARHDGAGWREVGTALAASAALAVLALALLALLGWLSARTTLYTLTDKRIVMRVGIVLTVTYNLPLRCIDEANVHPFGAGHGDLALVVKPDVRIAYLHLWPHARPWHLRRTQPMLRCLPRVDEVAAQVAQAWSAANARPAGTAPAALTVPAVSAAPTAPAMAAPGTARRPAQPTLMAGR